MLKRILLFVALSPVVACSQQSVEQVENTTANPAHSLKKFYYSKNFSRRYDIKTGEQISDWKGLIAVAIVSADKKSTDSCFARLYLGNDINFDYPQPENFINITGERHDEIFSFTSDVSDDDARIHAQTIFKAANKIMIRGYKGREISASTGFSIDYVMKDAAKGITFIKTDTALCDVLYSEDYQYYLLLKPKGEDKSENFLKLELPAMNKN